MAWPLIRTVGSASHFSDQLDSPEDSPQNSFRVDDQPQEDGQPNPLGWFFSVETRVCLLGGANALRCQRPVPAGPWPAGA